jgi:hypothetical protein
VRGLVEYPVITSVRQDIPVPPGRRSTELWAPRRGLFGHVAGRRRRGGGRLVRQDRRLPESVEAEEVAAFVADLDTQGSLDPPARTTCWRSGLDGHNRAVAAADCAPAGEVADRVGDVARVQPAGRDLVRSGRYVL